MLASTDLRSIFSFLQEWELGLLLLIYRTCIPGLMQNLTLSVLEMEERLWRTSFIGALLSRDGLSKCAEILRQDRCICISLPLPQAGEGWG